MQQSSECLGSLSSCSGFLRVDSLQVSCTPVSLKAEKLKAEGRKALPWSPYSLMAVGMQTPLTPDFLHACGDIVSELKPAIGFTAPAGTSSKYVPKSRCHALGPAPGRPFAVCCRGGFPFLSADNGDYLARRSRNQRQRL